MKKKIEIDYTEDEGEDRTDLKGFVIFKRLSFDELNKLEEESAEIKVTGTSRENISPQVNVKTARRRLAAVVLSVFSASLVKITYADGIRTEIPYKLDVDGIKNLPGPVGMALYGEYEAINEVSVKKKDESMIKFEEPSLGTTN